jgi:nucleotide-binding universal stress UspA family protein
VEEQLEAKGEELRSEGLRAQTLSLAGSVHDELLGASQREHADLIVLGTHGRTGFSRALFGSDAEALYRHAACPILVVGPAAQPVRLHATDGSWQVQEIVYASDLDPDSIPVAAFAAQLANEEQSKFTVLHVDDSEGKISRADHLDMFRRTFAEFLPETPIPSCTWRTLMAGYGLGSTIADFAVERNSDLIVMGAHSAFPAASHFARGIAPQVMAKAPCPVMILHKPF